MTNSFRATRPQAKTIESLAWKNLTIENLKTGHPIFLGEPSSIGVVRVELFWPAGTKQQTKPYQASLAVDLLLSGDESHSEYDVIRHLDHLGATYSTETNLLGSSLVFRCAKKHVSPVTSWVLKHVHTASYPRTEFENAIMIRRGSLERQQQTPKYWSSRIALESLYGKSHVLGSHGDLSEYQTIERNDLVDFKKQHLALSGLMLLVSGDYDPETVEHIEGLLKEFPSIGFDLNFGLDDSAPAIDGQQDNNLTTSILNHSMENTSQTSLQMVSHVVPKNQNERHRLTLLNLVLGGYFGSRLMQILREERGLTYGIGSYFRPAFQNYTWTISGELNSKHIPESIECIAEIFQSLKQIKISEEELYKIKQYYAGQFRGGFDGPFAINSKVQHLIYRGLPDDYYNTILPSIWAISAEDIMETANNYLETTSFITVLSGNTTT